MATPGTALPGANVPASSHMASGGAQGIQGIVGPTGPPAVATTTQSFVVPPIGSTVNVTVTDASWMQPGQMLAIGGAGGANLSGTLQLQSKAGNVLTLLNPAGPAWYPLADGTQPGLLAQLSGAPTDYVGGDNACHPLILPTGEYYDQDDFTAISVVAGGGSGSSKLFNLSASGTSTVIGQVTGNFPGHPGILQLAPGTVAGGYSRGYAGPIYLDANMVATLQGVVAIPTGSLASSNQYFFGFAQTVGNPLSATSYYAGFYASASPGGPNWMCYTRNTSTVQNLDSGVAVGSTTTWAKLKVVVSQGQVSFYINDTFIGTTSDGSVPPTGQFLWICFFTNNAAVTTNYSLYIDAADIWLQPVIPAGQAQTRFMRTYR